LSGAAADAPGSTQQPPASGGGHGATPIREGRSHLASLASRFLD
jgi:hypothetical protein